MFKLITQRLLSMDIIRKSNVFDLSLMENVRIPEMIEKNLFCRFVCKNNGVLFENEVIQIGVKSEFRQNLGRLGLFYGNKTSASLQVNT